MTTGQYRYPIFEVPKDSTATVLRMTLKKDGSALDLSSATGNKYFHAKTIGGTAVVTDLAATWTTDGSDGQIQITLTSALVGTVRDVICEWEVQGYNGGNQKSKPFILRVLPGAKGS